MKTIPLTKGMVALVDDADFEYLSRFKWCVLQGDCGRFYASRKGGTILMHREIMGALPGQEVDHRFQNTLDNQRRNLRIANRSQQLWNTHRKTNNTSGFKGVSWHSIGKKWRAEITHLGNRIYLGLFNSKIEAAITYDDKAVELFGDFACLNFPIIYG